jgi:hypothetical protein
MVRDGRPPAIKERIVKLMFSTQATRPARPVARNEDLLVEEIHDETVVFDTGTREAHCLSPLAAVVFSHCDGETSTDELAALATDRLGEPVDVERVQDALAQLGERNLLVASLEQEGLSRRQMIKRSAVTGGLVASAPLITSVFPPTAAAGSTATCGGPPPLPTVLCCPCTTGSGTNKDECCQPPFANKCVCTAAEGNASKFCKPSGVPSGHDATCEQCCTNQTLSGCGALVSGAGGNCTGSCPPAGSPCPGGCT